MDSHVRLLRLRFGPRHDIRLGRRRSDSRECNELPAFLWQIRQLEPIGLDAFDSKETVQHVSDAHGVELPAL
jgi:hypothetical protein